MALHALEVGAEHGYTYLILPHTGAIEDRVVKLGWYYHPRSMEIGPIPGMADKLAKPIYDAGLPVAVEAIGHEIEFAEPEQETNHNTNYCQQDRSGHIHKAHSWWRITKSPIFAPLHS